jgi:hypothetical protein
MPPARSASRYGLIGMTTSRWSTGGSAGLSVTGAPGSLPLPMMGKLYHRARNAASLYQRACDRLGSVHLMTGENCVCSPPDGLVALASGFFQSGPIKHLD